jgi:gluconokinase
VTRDCVVGVDIGTTGTRSVAYDASGAAWGGHEVRYPLHRPELSRAEQEPDEIVQAVATTLAAAVDAAQARGARVVAVGVSAALHSLLAVDGAGTPLTRVLTWADNRAAPQAAAIAADGGLELYQRTGTPLHPMAPLAKLCWFRDSEPDLFAAAARWLSIKEYVFERLLERSGVVDHSIASGTGLLDLETLDWDDDALAVAGVSRTQLSAPVPTDHALQLGDALAGRLGLPPDTPVVVGAGDGPLANLGAGALGEGEVVCTVGTSGAVRVVLPRRIFDPAGRLFCYALDAEHWTIGGPVNSGGIVLRWVRDQLLPDGRDRAEAEGHSAYEWLTELAASAPPGAGGIICLPHLTGERAPQWDASLRGVLWGLSSTHGRADVVRAVLEGVAYQLRAVTEVLVEQTGSVRAVRVTGGFTRPAVWRQILADVLAVDVIEPKVDQASCFGAAVLALVARGLVDSLEAGAALAGTGEVRHPQPDDVAVYRGAYTRFEELATLLAPTFS